MEVEIEYYEFEEVEVDEDDDIVDYINSTIAPFAQEEYSC